MNAPMSESNQSPHQRLLVLVDRVLERPPGAAPLPTKVRLNELGMSSMKMINLMLAIEVEFDVTIPQADITPDNFDTIASVQALLDRLLGSDG